MYSPPNVKQIVAQMNASSSSSPTSSHSSVVSPATAPPLTYAAVTRKRLGQLISPPAVTPMCKRLNRQVSECMHTDSPHENKRACLIFDLIYCYRAFSCHTVPVALTDLQLFDEIISLAKCNKLHAFISFLTDTYTQLTYKRTSSILKLLPPASARTVDIDESPASSVNEDRSSMARARLFPFPDLPLTPPASPLQQERQLTHQPTFTHEHSHTHSSAHSSTSVNVPSSAASLSSHNSSLCETSPPTQNQSSPSSVPMVSTSPTKANPTLRPVPSVSVTFAEISSPVNDTAHKKAQARAELEVILDKIFPLTVSHVTAVSPPISATHRLPTAVSPRHPRVNKQAHTNLERAYENITKTNQPNVPVAPPALRTSHTSLTAPRLPTATARFSAALADEFVEDCLDCDLDSDVSSTVQTKSRVDTKKTALLSQKLLNNFNVHPRAKRSKKFHLTVCQVCGFKAPMSSELLTHVYEHVMSTNEASIAMADDLPLMCPFCDRQTFPNETAYQRHVAAHRKDTITPSNIVRAAARLEYAPSERLCHTTLSSIINESISPTQFECLSDPELWLPDFILVEWLKRIVCHHRPDLAFIHPLLIDQFIKFGLEPEAINDHFQTLGSNWQKLFLPVSLHSHWFLCTVLRRENIILCHDPLHNNNVSEHVIQKLKTLVRRYVPGGGRGNRYPKFVYGRAHAVQQDSHSCGALVCLYALRFANHEDLTLSFDVRLIRQYIKDALQHGEIEPRLTMHYKKLQKRLTLSLTAAPTSTAQQLADQFGQNRDAVPDVPFQPPRTREAWVHAYTVNKKSTFQFLTCHEPASLPFTHADATEYLLRDESTTPSAQLLTRFDASLFPNVHPDNHVTLTYPITLDELQATIGRMNPSSAPGPDGLRLLDIRQLDPNLDVLLLLCNKVLSDLSLPTQWQESFVRMIPKTAAPKSLHDFRPIALNNVLYKIFSSVVNARLTASLTKSAFLSKSQKGFAPCEGVLEHGFAVDNALLQARAGEQDLALAFIDFTDAFGSVSFALIHLALSCAALDADSCTLVHNMIHGNSLRMMTSEGLSPPVPLNRGVRQGDPLSPVLFNMCLEIITRHFQLLHPVPATTFLAYADDIAILTQPALLATSLNDFSHVVNDFGLSINPHKSATLVIINGTIVHQSFQVNDAPLPCLQDGDIYKYLGGDKNALVHCHLHTRALSAVEACHKIKDSLLAPWQKLDALHTFVIPRFTHHLRMQQNDMKTIDELEDCLTRTARKILHLPDSCNKQYLYGSKSQGCMGIKRLSDEAIVHTVSFAFRLLSSPDPEFRSTVLTSLKADMTRARLSTHDSQTATSFLNAPCHIQPAQMTSPWLRLKNAIGQLLKRLPTFQFRLSHDFVPSISLFVTQHLTDRAQISHSLRQALSRLYSNALHSDYASQGKHQQALHKDKASWQFMHTGRHVSYSLYNWIHRARNNLLPVRANPMISKTNRGQYLCRRCTRPGASHNQAETLGHILCACPSSLNTHIVQRHNTIIDRIVRATHRNQDLTVVVDERMPHSGTQGRPDMVFKNDKTKEAFILDVSCPMENAADFLNIARRRKISKYEPQAAALRSSGYRVVVDAILVGALGTWDPANDSILLRLGIPRSYIGDMKLFIVIDTLSASKSIYYRHIYGPKFSDPQARNNALNERTH